MFGDMNQQTRNRISELKAIMPDRGDLHGKRYFNQGLFYPSELAPQMHETTKKSIKGVAIRAAGAFTLGKIPHSGKFFRSDNR